MKEKFRGKYRIDSVRLKSWDYSWSGHYFITICVKNRMQFFGKVVEGKMILSEMGQIVNQYWKEISEYFENVILDEFVVMPDHVHGIVVLKNSDRDAINRVSTSTSTSTSISTSTSTSKLKSKSKLKFTHIRGGITQNNNPMLSQNSLGKIIRWFKGRTTFEINKKYPYTGFQWQSKYYDHIIRNQKSLENIQQYIYFNPQKWNDEKNGGF